MLAGLGGAYLALDQHQFTDGMTAGRGFIALAATIFGGGIRCARRSRACCSPRPRRCRSSFRDRRSIPSQFVEMIPYVLTIVALAGVVGRAVRAGRAGQDATDRMPGCLDIAISLASRSCASLSARSRGLCTRWRASSGRSGEALDPDDHGLHRHGRAADGHPAAAVLRQVARGGRVRLGGVHSASDRRHALVSRSPSRSSQRADVGSLLRRVSAGGRRCSSGSARRRSRTSSSPSRTRCRCSSSPSRIVQGAGGGTVGVIQAYVADATEPEERAKALGWLSAATNARRRARPAARLVLHHVGHERAPRRRRCGFALWVTRCLVVAARAVLVNIVFAWRTSRESRDVAEAGHGAQRARRATRSLRVVEPLRRAGVAADLDLRHRDRRLSGCHLDARAVPRARFRVTERRSASSSSTSARSRCSRAC